MTMNKEVKMTKNDSLRYDVLIYGQSALLASAFKQTWLTKADILMQKVRKEPVTENNIEEFFSNLGL